MAGALDLSVEERFHSGISFFFLFTGNDAPFFNRCIE